MTHAVNPVPPVDPLELRHRRMRWWRCGLLVVGLVSCAAALVAWLLVPTGWFLSDGEANEPYEYVAAWCSTVLAVGGVLAVCAGAVLTMRARTFERAHPGLEPDCLSSGPVGVTERAVCNDPTPPQQFGGTRAGVVYSAVPEAVLCFDAAHLGLHSRVVPVRWRRHVPADDVEAVYPVDGTLPRGLWIRTRSRRLRRSVFRPYGDRAAVIEALSRAGYRVPADVYSFAHVRRLGARV